MGYYTDYYIRLSMPNKALIEQLEELSGEIFEGDNQEVSVNAKWYNCREHLAQITKKFPNVVVSVTGYGEEVADIWHEFWLNGQYQFEQLEIKFKPLCHSKLKEYINEEVLFN